MIKSDKFYASFTAGFGSRRTSPHIVRRRGKIPKYYAAVGSEEISFWFKVNPKASGLIIHPGEFWPVIETSGFRYNKDDNVIVSWYQYSDSQMKDEMKCLQWSVYRKLADDPLIRRLIEHDFREGSPHDALYYTDESDAELWGILFAMQLVPWMERFRAGPETLDGYMWRVHWGKSSRPPP